MKKIATFIIIAILSIFLSGCNFDYKNVPNTYEGGDFFNAGSAKKHTYADGTTMYVRHFVYNGHKYIEFFRLQQGLYDNNTGYVHDPDCQCMKK